MRKLLRLILLTLLAGLWHVSANAAVSPVGHWEGTVTREGKTWRIWVDVSTDKNLLTGTIDAPDYRLYALSLTEISLTDSKVRLERTDRSGKILLEGDLAGDEIIGQWEGLGVSASFELKRTQPQPVTFIQEEIRFQSGEATLVGTLQKPLETHWQAYLDGKFSREAALRQILIESVPAKK